MPQMTITEALAELKTLDKRVPVKEEFILAILCRQEAFKDPLEKDGGSFSAIARERQSMRDLYQRKVGIRRAIQQANSITLITIGKVTQSMADWLVWRRDVMPQYQKFLASLRNRILALRQDVQKRGGVIVTEGQGATKPQDWIVNINEVDLATEIEELETILGTLDGLLSLKNATVLITV